MIIDEESYFEHHGVKGMSWGKRKAQKREEKAIAKVRKSVDRRNKVKKVAVVSGIAAISAGSVYAKKKLREKGSTPISTLPTFKYNASGPGFKTQSNSLSAMNITLKVLAERQGK